MRTCVQVALVTVVECPLVLAPETPVTACPLWIVAVNRNQNLLGKTVLVVNRPVESVTALRPDEWADLHRQIARVTVALDELFAPDQYNHAFLMNADAHVHMHVVPRYRAVRSWGGQVFSDSHSARCSAPSSAYWSSGRWPQLAVAIRTLYISATFDPVYGPGIHRRSRSGQCTLGGLRLRG
jgi:diadenosine tetraphosphate (Ap4A) HIT family hydrolase